MMSRVRLVVWGAVAAVASSLLVAVPASGVSDAPHYCSAARPLTHRVWETNTLQYRSDVDWYSFELTDTRRIWAMLGDLPSNFRLSLYGACGAAPLAVSQRSGKTFEEIWKELPAGKYRLRVGRQPMAATSSTPYRIRFVAYGPGLHVVGTRWWRGPTGNRKVVGELLNNTERGHLHPSVKLSFYDRNDTLVGSYTGWPHLVWLGVGGRTSFMWRGSAPSSAVRYTFTAVEGSPDDAWSAPWLRVHGVRRTAQEPTVSFVGKVTNEHARDVEDARVQVTAYTARGAIHDTAFAWPDENPIRAGATTGWFGADLNGSPSALHFVRYLGQADGAIYR